MRKLLILISSLIFVSLSFGGNISEHPVFDFSGGMVNSIENNKMADNMALVLENYDLHEHGGLERRKGRTAYYIDSNKVREAFAYYAGNQMELFIVRIGDTTFAHDSAEKYIGRLYKYDGATLTRMSDEGFYIPFRQGCRKWNSSVQYWNNNLYFASSNAEMLVYNGDFIYPARPYGPAQPMVVGVDSTGTLDGSYKFKYSFYDTLTDSESVLSPASYEIDVVNGGVYIFDFVDPRDTTGGFDADSIKIYRSHADSNYGHAGTIGIDSTFWDNGTALADTITNGWNIYGSNSTPVKGPGMTRLVYTTSGVTCGRFSGLTDSVFLPSFHYMYMFADSSGRISYTSAVICTTYGDTMQPGGPSTDKFYVELFDPIVIPTDNYYKHTILCRMVTADSFQTADSAFFDKWFILDTLVGVGYYSDEKCNKVVCSMTTANIYYDGSTKNPDSLSAYNLSDSALLYQPSDLVIHGARAYSIGDYDYRNKVYYSQFGFHTNMPLEKTLTIQSYYGDWLVRILAHKNVLYEFRQNSILGLAGLSFYQYELQQIRSDVGLTWPRALTYFHDDIFYGNNEGIFSLSDPLNPITLPIENTVDSINDSAQNVYLANVNNELWFSMATGSNYRNNKTYVYDPAPTPHWKSYSFGINSVTRYDSDGSWVDFNPNRFIVLDSDSLWKWNYSDTDTLDGTELVVGTYQSKFFFDDADREKILWIDFYGTGTYDTLTFTFLSNYGQDTLGTSGIGDSLFSTERTRIKVGYVCDNFSLKIEDAGVGDYVLKGYVIGHIDNWDRGKVR